MPDPETVSAPQDTRLRDAWAAYVNALLDEEVHLAPFYEEINAAAAAPAEAERDRLREALRKSVDAYIAEFGAESWASEDYGDPLYEILVTEARALLAPPEGEAQR